ncbi:MAG: hypothetical protein WBP54_12935 [Pelodictyon phaeoclathratiforme]
MNVKDVVTIAVNHVGDLFEHENITNLGLEEIEFDDQVGEWFVTVGFSRPWDYPYHAALAALGGEAGIPKRSFKTVRVNKNGEVLAVKNREVMS